MKHSFRNDYNTIGHPDILQVLVNNAKVVNVGYGFDEETKKLNEKVKNITKQDVECYALAGGTQTNLIAISKVLFNYEGVISVESGHINVHETAAVEGSGHKIITVPGKNGKVYPEDVENVISNYADCHMVKPSMVYISNSTEIGTVYNKEELINLYNVCKKYNLYLFLDGARLPVALTCEENDMTIEDIAAYTDAFYLGGTKNGMPLGELLVLKHPDMKKDFKYHLKNKGGMLSKSYFLSYMFNAYLKDNFYLNIASKTNEFANYLRSKLTKVGIEIVYPNPTNQIFCSLNDEQLNKIEKDYDFEVWEKRDSGTVIRLVTSWCTTKQAIDDLISDLK